MELLVSRQGQAQLHQPAIKKWVSRLDAERGCRLVGQLERIGDEPRLHRLAVLSAGRAASATLCAFVRLQTVDNPHPPGKLGPDDALRQPPRLLSTQPSKTLTQRDRDERLDRTLPGQPGDSVTMASRQGL